MASSKPNTSNSVNIPTLLEHFLLLTRLWVIHSNIDVMGEPLLYPATLFKKYMSLHCNWPQRYHEKTLCVCRYSVYVCDRLPHWDCCFLGEDKINLMIHLSAKLAFSLPRRLFITKQQSKNTKRIKASEETRRAEDRENAVSREASCLSMDLCICEYTAYSSRFSLYSFYLVLEPW